jgi:hypothetical protein
MSASIDAEIRELCLASRKQIDGMEKQLASQEALMVSQGWDSPDLVEEYRVQRERVLAMRKQNEESLLAIKTIIAEKTPR